GLRPDGDAEDAKSPVASAPYDTYSRGSTFAEARRTPPFWLMAVSFSLLSATIHGCITHLAPLLTDQGLSAQQAAAALMLFSAMGAVRPVTTRYLPSPLSPPFVATH